MSEEFDEFMSAGVADSLEAMGGSFTWNGKPYACIVDHVKHTLTTAKALFPGGKYPQRGQTIIVAGKKRQVSQLANSSLSAVAGGFVENQPFVDDPGDPGLDIEFDKLFKK